MSFKSKVASAVCMTAMFASIAGAHASGAYAQEANPASFEPPVQVAPPPLDVIQTPAVDAASRLPVPDSDVKAVALGASSLAELVAAIPAASDLSRDLDCLASAIYFEARGEPLIGQLAVGSVIVNRASSGRFPTSYCGVVFQRAQFSFVRGGRMPSINRQSAAWKHAKAVATIADEGLWASPARDALFFHATYVRPGWKLQRVAQVNTHVFYR